MFQTTNQVLSGSIVTIMIHKYRMLTSSQHQSSTPIIKYQHFIGHRHVDPYFTTKKSPIAVPSQLTHKKKKHVELGLKKGLGDLCPVTGAHVMPRPNEASTIADGCQEHQPCNATMFHGAEGNRITSCAREMAWRWDDHQQPGWFFFSKRYKKSAARASSVCKRDLCI